VNRVLGSRSTPTLESPAITLLPATRRRCHAYTTLTHVSVRVLPCTRRRDGCRLAEHDPNCSAARARSSRVSATRIRTRRCPHVGVWCASRRWQGWDDVKCRIPRVSCRELPDLEGGVRREDLTEVHSIQPIETVPSILQLGILSNRRARRVAHSSIADPMVQERRAEVVVPGGRHLHEYANLYFHARNPMMYRARGLTRSSAYCASAQTSWTSRTWL
jgi:hypothetical protein